MPKATVELHQAFMWVCDECGRDIFERAREYRPTHEERAELADEIGDECEGAWLLGPESVTCPHCRAEFATADY